jgi:hypothetical protein
MDIAVYNLRVTDDTVCVHLRRTSIIVNMDAIHIYAPLTTKQRTRFPECIVDGRRRITLPPLAYQEDTVVILDAMPSEYTDLVSSAEWFSKTASLVIPSLEQQKKAMFTFFCCRVAEFMESLKDFLLKVYVNGPCPSQLDITCFQQEFVVELRGLYQEIYDYHTCTAQDSLLRLCQSLVHHIDPLSRELDSILSVTHMLAHNATCLGTGTGTLMD